MACRVRPSVHAAYQKQGQDLGVSIKQEKEDEEVGGGSETVGLAGVAAYLNADLRLRFRDTRIAFWTVPIWRPQNIASESCGISLGVRCRGWDCACSTRCGR